MPPKAAPAAAAAPVTDADMQATLFRLTILLATSLSTLSTPPAPTVHALSSTLPAPAYYATLSAQLHADVLSLLQVAQKCASSLTLALRRGARQAAPEGSTSATAGMDSGSLAAAKAQLETLAHEVLPKLAFLCAKAGSESVALLSTAREPSAEEQRERERIAKEVAALGGRVLPPAGKARPVPGLGVGKAFAKALAASVARVLEALVELLTALMDARTHAAVAAAAAARARADGLPPARIAPPRAAASSAQAREAALQATAKVWAACDEAGKAMPRSNGEAVRRRWREREETMDDGWEELKAEADSDAPAAPAEEQEEEDEEDPLAALQDMQLSVEERATAQRYVPLLKLGRILHRAAGAAALAEPTATPSATSQPEPEREAARQPPARDLDALDALAQRVAERQDDLVAALLYGGADGLDMGLESDEEDEESEEQADEDGEDEEEEEEEEADVASVCAAYVASALELAAALGVQISSSSSSDTAPPSAPAEAAAPPPQEESAAAAGPREGESKAQHTMRMCAEGMRRLAGTLAAHEPAPEP